MSRGYAGQGVFHAWLESWNEPCALTQINSNSMLSTSCVAQSRRSFPDVVSSSLSAGAADPTACQSAGACMAPEARERLSRKIRNLRTFFTRCGSTSCLWSRRSVPSVGLALAGWHAY